MTRRNLIVIVGLIALIGAILTGALVVLGINNFDNIINWVESSSDPQNIVYCYESAACRIVHPIVFGLLLVFVILTGFAYTTLLERRILAFLQQRVGPNRVGPLGFLQPAADGLKLIFKEDIIPAEADKPIYYLAPILKAVPIIIVVAVIPFGPPLLVPWLDGNWYVVPQVLADVNVGILWILGITSLATYGIVLAGWSSNNKYAMLGGLRATAQMISYELSMGLGMAVPVIIAGSMNVTTIVDMQKWPWEWFFFQNPLAAGILVLALFAEVSRAPFDLTEAEQELTAGYMTEYSGMKFAIFMMAEYIGMISVSLIASSLYFGGYHLFPVDNVPLLGPVFLIGKVVLFLALFIWARGTLPRVRYDRLMALGWKVLIPLAIVAIAWTSIAVVVREYSFTAYVIASAIFFLVVVGGGLFFLNSDGDEVEDPQDDWINDPMITGERNSLGWGALQAVGTVLAAPFALVNGLASGLEKLGEAADPSDETAIVPREQGGD